MRKILVVDDEKEQLYSIEKFFSNFYGDRYKILSAVSGKQCFKILEHTIPDIIILDIMMPEMNGWEVIEQLKLHPAYQKIPVIILTARTDGFARDAGKLMAVDYIAKPIDCEELKIRIDKVLKKGK
jgi:CheY-like chemotaxis protein